METLNERAGFLCNHEVLALLRSQRQVRDEQIKRLAERQRANKRKGLGDSLEVSEGERIRPQDLHTVTFEAIRYLEDAVHPTRRQTAESVSTLLDALDRYDLTKAERLQLVNSAPTSLVELHVCIEDLEERFPGDEAQESLLSEIRSHLSRKPVQSTTTASSSDATKMELDRSGAALERDEEDDEGWDQGDDGGFVQETRGGGEERELDEDPEET
ncbi:hypothetical protein JCM10212_007098 [Sporobolomyces blumeae]